MRQWGIGEPTVPGDEHRVKILVSSFKPADSLPSLTCQPWEVAGLTEASLVAVLS